MLIKWTQLSHEGKSNNYFSAILNGIITSKNLHKVVVVLTFFKVVANINLTLELCT